MNFEPIAGADWEDFEPYLRDALHDIAVRAAGRAGISLQHALDGHLSAFNAAARDRVSHQILARLLHEAGVAGRNGEAPSVGSFSSALSRARAKYEANARRAAPYPRPANTPVDAVSNAAENKDAAGPYKASPEIRSAIEPGAARLPIPPPADVPDADTLMASALRRGRLLNELKALRHDHQPNDEGSSVLHSVDIPDSATLMASARSAPQRLT